MTVKNCNDDDCSSCTDSSTSNTVQGASVTGPPIGLSVSNPQTDSLTLGWTPPTGNSNDHTDTVFQVGYSTNLNANSPSTVLADESQSSPATVTGLAAGTEYKLFVRSVVMDSAGAEILTDAASAYQTTTGTTEPAEPEGPEDAELTDAFADLALDHDEVRTLDMSDHFSGDDLSYEVMVTTTHNVTKVVRTAPINTVARNKIRGSWSDDVLTLTAGAAGEHVLTLEITASNDGSSASDSFEVTVGIEAEDPEETDDPATLIQSFPDLSLANSVTHDLDMTAHFSGSGLSYGVMVTTTNKRTGQVRKGPINTVARNKVTGVWSGDVLTLTTGAAGEHVLTLDVTATDAAGGTASDDFQLTVGAAANAGNAANSPPTEIRGVTPVPALPLLGQLLLALFMIAAGGRLRLRKR